MTRRALVHKWSFYALALLVVWVLDAYVLPRYPVFGLSPMLLPLAGCAAAVLEGSRAGAGFGMYRRFNPRGKKISAFAEEKTTDHISDPPPASAISTTSFNAIFTPSAMTI